VSFWRGVDPTLPPPTLFGVAVTVLYKHYSVAAIQIFKNPETVGVKDNTPPPKNYKKFQGTMSNVGHGIIKKAPNLATRGKDGNSTTIKEKQ
jgi:hypothetical protein